MISNSRMQITLRSFLFKKFNIIKKRINIKLILILFFIILNFLNKKERKVICMREFEIILLQTQNY
jgi:hypothetical protein